jgi:GntR family transcriptional regulator
MSRSVPTYVNAMKALQAEPQVPAEASDQPRYVWLANIIRSAIERNNLSDNQVIPSERELAEKYDVSRDTVRKTIRLLENQGVLYSEHGRGTFVAPAVVRRMAQFVDGFSENSGARGGVVGQRILAVEPALASMAMAGLLGVRAGSPLTRVRRLRLIDQQPVGLHDAYVLQTGSMTIDRAALEKHGSLYALMREQFDIVPTEAIENLSAAKADEEDALLLKVEKDSPLLVVERLTLSERREPIEYCLMKYVPSYRYSSHITRHHMGVT